MALGAVGDVRGRDGGGGGEAVAVRAVGVAGGEAHAVGVAVDVLLVAAFGGEAFGDGGRDCAAGGLAIARAERLC